MPAAVAQQAYGPPDGPIRGAQANGSALLQDKTPGFGRRGVGQRLGDYAGLWQCPEKASDHPLNGAVETKHQAQDQPQPGRCTAGETLAKDQQASTENKPPKSGFCCVLAARQAQTPGGQAQEDACQSKPDPREGSGRVMPLRHDEGQWPPPKCSPALSW